MKCLEGMTLAEQVEHLKWLVEELTTPPVEFDGLRPTERRIVAVLLRHEGKTVPMAALWAAADLDRLPDDASRENNVKVHVCRARKALAGTVEIHTTWGIGYRAVLV